MQRAIALVVALGGTIGGCPTRRTPSDDAASVDAHDAGGSPAGDAYRMCTSDGDCTAGDVCTYWWNRPDVPVPSPPPRTFCRPACTTDADCPGLAPRAPTCAEARCAVRCFPAGGEGPDCPPPYVCSFFAPSTHDGYCVLER